MVCRKSFGKCELQSALFYNHILHVLSKDDYKQNDLCYTL